MFRIKMLLQEPLLHFCLVGGLFFWLAGGLASVDNEIVVNAGLKTALVADYERKHGMEPSAAQLEGLTDTWIDDEILYREALRLGLAESDPVMRRRLIQAMKFLAEDEAGGLAATEKQLQAVLAENSEALTIQPTVSFEHVFFKKENTASLSLDSYLVKLESNKPVTGSDAFIHGQKFDGLTRSRINTLFGEAFADGIFGLKVNRWLGPLRSSFGDHLVRVNQYEEARVPVLDEVANQVVGLWREQERDKALARRLQRLRGEYKIVDESDAR
jgi:hypothetical protein